MRIESPVLGLAGRDWARLGDSFSRYLWLCNNTVQKYWNIGDARRIVLVASDKKVAGAQKVRCPKEHSQHTTVWDSTAHSHNSYRSLITFLREASEEFGLEEFYGWIEIIEPNREGLGS